MMRFSYQAEAIRGAVPPSVPRGIAFRRRPLIPIRVYGATGRFRSFRRALIDTGADDTLFPWDVAILIKAALLPPTGLSISWRGNSYPVRFAQVELELSTTKESCRLPAMVGFTSAPIAYPLLGVAGFLESFEATFHGDGHYVDLLPSATFRGSMRAHA